MYNIINEDINLPVLDENGKESGKIKLESQIFGAEPHMPSVQLAVRVELANSRQATAKTKTRSEVSGGGKKPWRQKGTGRARAGSSRSPVWRHGGTVFGPTGNQSFKLKINKAVYFRAFISVLSDKLAQGKITIVEFKEQDLASKKTKLAAEHLEKLGVKKGEKVCYVLDDIKENLIYSLYNIDNCETVLADNLSIFDILNADRVIMSSHLAHELGHMVCCDECGCEECEGEKENA